jgi:signal transduction histidine kinase
MAACLGYIGFGAYIFRTYDQIGVRGLSAFSIAWGFNFIVTSTAIVILATAGFTSGAGITFISFSRPVEIFLLASTPIGALLTVGGVLAWFWFILKYTTRVRRRDELIILGLGAAIAVVVAANGTIGALASLGYIPLENSTRLSVVQFANLFEILGLSIAIGIGTAQLFRTARRHPPFEYGAAAGLSFPIIFPYLVRYLYQFNLVIQFPRIQFLRLIALLIGLAGCVAATHHYRIFDELPAAQAVGRENSFDTVNTAITVLDDRDRISDINTAAEALFDIENAEAIGTPISEVVPDDIDQAQLIETGECIFELPGGKIINAETTVTTDERDREFGRVIVFKDITTERRRRQRIQVLNRVLRHNLRNSLVVARGRLDVLPEEHVSLEENIPKIQERLNHLLNLGSKAGTIEEILDADIVVETPRQLTKIVRMAIEEVEKEHDTPDIEIRGPDHIETTINPLILDAVLTELVENAVEHASDADITIEVLEDGGGIRVSDTGPGIPENERAVFVTGEETALQHGSGIGLWLAKWGAGRIGGELTVDTGDSGTDILVSLPPDLVVTDSQAVPT